MKFIKFIFAGLLCFSSGTHAMQRLAKGIKPTILASIASKMPFARPQSISNQSAAQTATSSVIGQNNGQNNGENHENSSKQKPWTNSCLLAGIGLGTLSQQEGQDADAWALKQGKFTIEKFKKHQFMMSHYGTVYKALVQILQADLIDQEFLHFLLTGSHFKVYDFFANLSAVQIEILLKNLKITMKPQSLEQNFEMIKNNTEKESLEKLKVMMKFGLIRPFCLEQFSVEVRYFSSHDHLDFLIKAFLQLDLIKGSVPDIYSFLLSSDRQRKSAEYYLNIVLEYAKNNSIKICTLKDWIEKNAPDDFVQHLLDKGLIECFETDWNEIYFEVMSINRQRFFNKQQPFDISTIKAMATEQLHAQYIDPYCKKIDQAVDLTAEEKLAMKEKLLSLSIDIVISELEVAKAFSCIDMDPDKLAKYLAFATWSNQYNKCPERAGGNIKKSYTQRLSRNIKQAMPTCGLYQLFSNKIKHCFYEAGFVCELEKNEKVMQQVIAAEQEFENKGYVTFVHGRRWEWNFYTDICRLIQSVKGKAVQGQEVIFRSRTDDCNVQEFQEWRKDLVQNGVKDFTGTATQRAGKESEVIFMNRSLFSNNGCYGECTGTYVLQNHSRAEDGQALQLAKKAIENHGLENYINQDQLQALYKKHKKCNNALGEIVMIAVPQEKVDEMVYPAGSGGLKNINKSASQCIKEMNERIMTNPVAMENQRQFYCLAVPDMPDEKKSYQTRSIPDVNLKLYAQYQAEFAAMADNVRQKYNAARRA